MKTESSLSPKMFFPRIPAAKHSWLTSRWLLVFVLGLGLIVRFLFIGSESIWIDEAYSIQLARLPIKEIIQATGADQHPPLYYLLLHAWLLPPTGILSARLLSVLIGTAHIAATMSLARRLNSAATGVLIGLLLVISPMHVFFSQEARMYILAALLTTIASGVLWDGLEKTRAWVLYTVIFLTSIYTHYLTIFVFISHFVIVLVWSLQRSEYRTLRRWLLSALAVLAGFLPWIRIAWNQFNQHQMPWVSSPSVSSVLNVFLRMLAGDGVLLFPVILRMLTGLGVFAFLIFSLIKERTQAGSSNRQLQFLAIWGGVGFMGITLVSVFYPIFQFKQYLIVLVPLLLWTIQAIAQLPKRFKKIAILLLIGCTSFSLAFQQILLTKDDWRSAATILAENASGDELIFTNPAAARLPLTLYWGHDSTQIAGYPLDYTITDGGWDGIPITQDIARNIIQTWSQYSAIWYLEFDSEFWDPHGLLELELSRSGSVQRSIILDRIRIRKIILDAD
jgi:uncharacterized membrane protein